MSNRSRTDRRTLELAERRRIERERYAKRRQADLQELLKLFRRHAVDVVDTHWPDAFDPWDLGWMWEPEQIEYNGEAGIRGIYHQLEDRTPGLIILSTEYYYSDGLREMLRVVNHELIHAWQDSTGHPLDHGESFLQWVDTLDAQVTRICE